MKTYEIELEDGKTYEVDVDDSQPIEQSIKNDSIESRLKEPIPQRPNPFMEGAEAMKSAYSSPMDLAGIGRRGMAGMQVLAAPYMAAESIIAKRAMSGQEGIGKFTNPKQMLSDVTQGIVGPRATLGDVNYRAGLSRPVADFTGGAQSLTLQAPELIESGFQLASKGLSKGAQAIANSGFGKLTGEIFSSGKNLSKANVASEQIAQKIASLQDAKKVATEALTNASVDDAVLYKTKLRPLSKANSKIYREGLDEAEKSANLTSQKFSSILDESVREAAEQGIDEGSASIQKMKEISSKLNSKTERVWNPETASYEQIAVDRKMTIEQVRDIKNQIYKVANQSQDHADEIGNAIFMKNYGNEIASQSKTFQPMQAEYAPFLEAKKWAYRIFKPFTKDEIPQGYNVLRRIAKGNPNEVDFAYLRRLEEGSGRFQGTGNLRGKSQSMADSLESISNEIKSLREAKVKNAESIERLKKLKLARTGIVLGALSTLGGIGAVAKKAHKGYQLISL